MDQILQLELNNGGVKGFGGMDQILQLVLNNGGVKRVGGSKWIKSPIGAEQRGGEQKMKLIKFSNWCLTFRVIW